MSKPHRLEHPEFYLSEDTFARAAFDGHDGHRSNLFSPEFKKLLDTLYQILKDRQSLENLEFLIDIHKLNAQDDLTSEEVQTQLKKIEDTYITDNSDKVLNLHQKTLEKIRKAPVKSLLIYQKAVEEIFLLISANVTEHAPLLKIIDTVIVVNKAAQAVAQELNKFILLPMTKPPSRISLFKHKRREEIFIECQNFCKEKQGQLVDLVKDESKDAGCLRTYNKLNLEILQKLSADFQQIQQLEKRMSKGSKKLAPLLEQTIIDINEIDKSSRIKLVTASRISGRKGSEHSRSNSLAIPETSSQKKSPRLSESKTLPPVTPPRTPRSDIVEEKDRSSTPFRNSSRILPSPIEENDSPRTLPKIRLRR